MQEAATRDVVGGRPELSATQHRLLLAQLPDHLQNVAKRFRQITGLSVVAAVVSHLEEQCVPESVVPPMHPVCAELAGHSANPMPCAEEWAKHVRHGQATRQRREHACALGLRCACVPVLCGPRLVGMCKLVTGPEIPIGEFRLAVEVLELLVDRACHNLHATALADELVILRSQVGALRSATFRPPMGTPVESSETSPPASGISVESRSLASRALDHLNQHYTDPELSVTQVARALQVNDKYLSNVFSRHLGKRMHAYIVELRVRRACEMLLGTGWQIKRIATECGFSDAAHFGRSFRRRVGVAAGDYRRIFAAGN